MDHGFLKAKGRVLSAPRPGWRDLAAITIVLGTVGLVVIGARQMVAPLASPSYAGGCDLADIAGALALKVNELFPIAAALHILEFAELKEASIKLTAAGRVFAESGVEERKRLFGEHLLRFVPLAAHIHGNDVGTLALQ